jgi:hypothetical protein
MGTKFQTMLAPIGLSTGDGRRFKTGAINLADVPFPFEWARSREGGHDGAVVVGAVQEAAVLTVKDALAGGWISAEAAKGMDSALEAVWAKGELFDGVSREEMPRLAEDVAEAMHLMSAGTLGPSVDLDSFEGVPVIEGTDEEVTWERLEEIVEETGEEPRIELLITQGRVRAATLVSIPAFAETSRPLELIEQEHPDHLDEAAADTETMGAAALECDRELALVASVTELNARPFVTDFDMPALTGPTPITFDWETGRVFGHIATWQTCHVGYSDVCVTAPRDETGDYSWFNRFPVETHDGGTIWAGRLTVGGRHAGLELAASSAMAVYDQKAVAAHVRAYEDEFGIVLAGVIELASDAPERAALDRRRVSGDWRETADGLSLVEVLALSPGPRAHSEPGFPIPGTFSRSGRQVALTAALGPVPAEGFRHFAAAVDIAGAVRQALAEDRAAEAARATLGADLAAGVAREREALAAALGTNEEG